MKKKHIYKLIPLILLVAFGLWWKFSDTKQVKIHNDLSKKLKFIFRADKAFNKISKYWNKGSWDLSIEDIPACRHLVFKRELVGKKYWECNEDYIDCYLSAAKFEGLHVVKKQNLIGEDRNLEIFSQAYHAKSGIGHFGIVVELTDGENTLSKFFPKTCHEITVRDRVYITKSSKGTMLWDNHDFQPWVNINKFMVTNRDVNWWIATDHEAPKNKLETNTENWPKPSTRLTMEEKHRFCAFRGERLLESHFYDAATVMPSDLKNNKNRYLKFYPYPWTKNFKRVFAYMSRNTSNIVDLITKKNCNHIFSKECLEKFKFKFFDTNSVSWMGMYQLLGGYPEIVRNVLEKDKPLKSSSFYLPIDSIDHELGMRVSLDKYSREEIPEVGFRCMRER